MTLKFSLQFQWVLTKIKLKLSNWRENSSILSNKETSWWNCWTMTGNGILVFFSFCPFYIQWRREDARGKAVDNDRWKGDASHATFHNWEMDPRKFCPHNLHYTFYNSQFISILREQEEDEQFEMMMASKGKHQPRVVEVYWTGFEKGCVDTMLVNRGILPYPNTSPENLLTKGRGSLICRQLQSSVTKKTFCPLFCSQQRVISGGFSPPISHPLIQCYCFKLTKLVSN